MQNDELVPAKDFCQSHDIEVNFIQSLQDFGLVQITTIEDAAFIPVTELNEVEKMVRLHYELNINFEGLDAVRNLLDQINQMQEEMNQLRNRLKLFEGNVL